MKTEAVWIGANIGKEENLNPEKGFIYGMWLSTNPEITIEANYSKMVTKVRNSLSCWELRRLTLQGKIAVLKSLYLPLNLFIFCRLCPKRYK